jgi:hypothetical protein
MSCQHFSKTNLTHRHLRRKSAARPGSRHEVISDAAFDPEGREVLYWFHGANA